MKHEPGTYYKNARKTKKRHYKLSTRAEKPLEAVVDFFRARILIDDQLLTSPDGPHTWILKQLPDDKVMLVAARTETHQELGTLHLNLDAFSRPAPVIAAGELAKKDKMVAFNLISGTFMRPIFRQFRSQFMVRNEQEKILKRVAAHLKSLGFEDVAFLTYSDGEEHDEYDDDREYLDNLAGGAPILDAEYIFTRMSEILEYNRLLSGENVSTEEDEEEESDSDDE